MTFKKILLCNVVFYLCLSSVSTFAADQAANEETLPPNEDGPLTAQQIQPINVSDQQNAVAPQQPATQPNSTEGQTAPVAQP